MTEEQKQLVRVLQTIQMILLEMGAQFTVDLEKEIEELKLAMKKK